LDCGPLFHLQLKFKDTGLFRTRFRCSQGGAPTYYIKSLKFRRVSFL